MDRDELWRQLVPMMKQDPDYQQALQRLETAEPEYMALLETLKPEQREILERYIAATEALDDPLIYLAYQIGMPQRLPLEGKLSPQVTDEV